MVISGNFSWTEGPIVTVHIARTHVMSVGGHPPNRFQFRALLDTGASNTAISESVQDEVQLEQLGYRSIKGAHRDLLCPTCDVDLFIAADGGKSLALHAITVPVLAMPQGSTAAIPRIQVLIGRDVLRLGTFTMTEDAFRLEIPDP